MNLVGRMNIAEAMRAKWQDPEYRKMMSEKHRGHKHSDSHKAKISSSLVGRVCSKETRMKIAASNSGKVRTLEQRARMSEAKKKNPIRYWLGKQRSPETVAKMSKSRIGFKMSPETKFKISLSNRGEKAYQWKGGYERPGRPGIVNHKYRAWRTAIFEKDSYTCALCKTVGGNLHAHHIIEWKESEELRYEVSNGVCLCYGCHKAIHKIYRFIDKVTEN